MPKKENYCKRNGRIIEEKVAGKSWFTRAKDEDHCQSRSEQGRELAEAQQLVQLFSAATIYLIHLRRKKRKIL